MVIERAGRPDRADRYPDAATMAAALADVAARLPEAAPLSLPGLGDAAEDPDPTRSGTPTSARPGESETIEEGVYAIPVRPGRSRRVSAVPFVVGAALVAAIVLAAVLLLTGGAGPGVAAPTLIGQTSNT